MAARSCLVASASPVAASVTFGCGNCARRTWTAYAWASCSRSRESRRSSSSSLLPCARSSSRADFSCSSWSASAAAARSRSSRISPSERLCSAVIRLSELPLSRQRDPDRDRAHSSDRGENVCPSRPCGRPRGDKHGLKPRAGAADRRRLTHHRLSGAIARRSLGLECEDDRGARPFIGTDADSLWCASKRVIWWSEIRQDRRAVGEGGREGVQGGLPPHRPPCLPVPVGSRERVTR